MEVATLMQSTFTSSSEDDRRARESELRSLEAYRLRLEHETRVADELVRIDILARRLSSRPPPALASIPVPAPSAPPPAMSSGPQLPFADASSGGWPALTMDVVPEERTATTSAPSKLSFVAAAISVSALISFVILALALRPSAATADNGARAANHAASEPKAMPAQPPQQPAQACGTDAKEPAPAASAPVVPVAPVAAAPIAPTRTATRASRAPHSTSAVSPSPAPTSVSATTATPAPQIDQAARTAQMLREQLGTTLH